MELRPGYKQTEVGVIPEDWTIGKLEDFSSFISYGFTNPMPSVENGIYMITAADINDGGITYDTARYTAEVAYRNLLTQKSKPKKDDVLLTKDGSLGRLALVGDEVICINQSVAVIRPNDKVDPAFLKLLLESPRCQKKMIEDAGGSTIKHIYITIVNLMQIAVPKSLQEQRAIAAALSDVDALLAKLDQLIAKKLDFKRAAMQQLLTGQTRLPGFSGGWEVKRFGELFQFLNTANNPRADLTAFGDVGYIHYGDIHTTASACLDLAQDTLPLIAKRKVAHIPLVEDGDLVMADASEDYEGIGKCVEMRNTDGRRIVAGLHTFLLRGHRDLVADGFKGYLQFIPSVRAALVRFATGISVFGVSKSNVRRIEVLLPPVDEQTAIAAVLSDMDAELAALEQRLAKTRTLKQGMMQELLTGRTRLV